MLLNFKSYKHFVVCGKTDMRCGVYRLSRRIQDDFKINPFSKSMFLFCGGSGYRTLKMLAWEPTGFYLITKYVNLDSKGFSWPRNEKEAKNITYAELEQLLDGVDIFRRITPVRGIPLL